MSVRFIFRGLLVMVILVLITWLLKDVLDQGWIDARVRDNGVAGVLLFVLVCCLLGSAGLSRQVIAFLGGYAFGFSQGVVLSMVAVVAACIATFYVSRVLLRSYLSKRFSTRIQQIDAFLRGNTFTMALLVRLLPLGSNWMINIAAGVSSVRKLPFFLGSALGYIPQMLIFSLLGSGTRVDQFWQVAIAMALFVLAATLGIVLYRNVARGKTLGQTLDRELGVETSAVTQE
ncbi:MAG: VTT domain-containing protein [Pseudomonadota bacterium]